MKNEKEENANFLKQDYTEEKKYTKKRPSKRKIIMLAAIIVTMVLVFTIVGNLFNVPTTTGTIIDLTNEKSKSFYLEKCGTVNASDIELSDVTVHEDGHLLCVFDNGLESYLPIDENSDEESEVIEMKSNPNYKVCYKILNFDKNSQEYVEGGRTC